MLRCLAGILCVLFSFSVSLAQEQDYLTDKLLQEPLEKLVEDAQRFGDPARGAVAFYKPELNCAKCHLASSTRRRLGPDLAEKRVVSWEHLAESILKPSEKIKEGFETVSILDLDGNLITGVLVEQTETHLVVDQIEQPEKPLRIALDDIEEWKKTSLSTMPAALANQLGDRNEFLDLVAYLKKVSVDGVSAEVALRPATFKNQKPLPEYESRIDHRGLIGSWNKVSLQRGAELFRLRCASCHGTRTEEGSMPTSLRFASGKFKRGSDPHSMYLTLTHGYGMMNAQRWMVPQQKYDVIHYIRETFVKDDNPTQYFDVTKDYLANLPTGDTRGPKPNLRRPWSEMDYGPSFNNTIEISKDGSNIAQKGMTIRLDDGPGGVESGSHWITYEHDTIRVAGAWSGNFIDYNGIHFNGVHGRHPKATGDVHFATSDAPGFARPGTGDFTDARIKGRDGRSFGPLPSEWMRYNGMYRFGDQVILDYQVGQTKILESPRLEFQRGNTTFVRTLNLDAREKQLVLNIATYSADRMARIERPADNAVWLPSSLNQEDERNKTNFDGQTFFQTKPSIDLSKSFTIEAIIQTKANGTLFAQTVDDSDWVPNGQTFFLRNGRIGLDIGWVGEVFGRKKVNDGKRHRVSASWNATNKRVTLRVDGEVDKKGQLAPREPLDDAVFRIGFTNNDFPNPSPFRGSIHSLRLYDTDQPEWLGDDSSEQQWLVVRNGKPSRLELEKRQTEVGSTNQPAKFAGQLFQLVANRTGQSKKLNWETTEAGDLRLVIPPGPAMKLDIRATTFAKPPTSDQLETTLAIGSLVKPPSLTAYTKGGPKTWPQTFKTDWELSESKNGFAVDVLKRPTDNPWNDRLRLTGIDFFADGTEAIISAWDGTIWRVSGIDQSAGKQATWQKIACGLFQPLGVKIVNEEIFVTCRDQLVKLHDLNGDREIDWYENFNSDHQVTEHFHEFAMGLQVDDDGNFYYAKSARHALPALVPHHGTLLKVSADGATTEIVANGFRAANGVCLNPDGSFIVTDQEGHWNPKNRINWVQPGGFYGNMYGYTDVTDSSDEAMDQPLCWITNAFDRSPSELLWVPQDCWGPLGGSLLNFSYGYGKIYVVPHESVEGQMQGGMCEFPISQFPTGVMRGRFHERDGNLYCCGMFAWAGNQQQPGGMYRVRYTGEPVHLPIGLKVRSKTIEIKMTDKLDAASVADPKNFAVKVWDLKRTKNYGSKHYNERPLEVVESKLLDDKKTIVLTVPDVGPTWSMEIVGALKSESGKPVRLKIHNTIHNTPSVSAR